MTVYLPPDCVTWRYRFAYKGKPYSGSTEQSTKKAAEIWETAYRKDLRAQFEQAELRRVAGIEPLAESPRIADWAAVYEGHVAELVKQGRVTRPDRIADLLRVVLRFWGTKPDRRNRANPPKEGEPYHDLRLLDPIQDPEWIEKFEAWMSGRGVAGQTKDQYRSTLSQMYKLALQPKWRKRTGVQVNPFAGIFRDGSGTRDVTIAPADLRRLLEHASYHLRLAVSIGALAPKLRLANILALRYSVNFDPQLHFITVAHHKTVTKTKRPLVIPASAQLRTILLDAQARARPRPPGQDYVVTYRGKPIGEVRGALKAACKAAGLPYGRFVENGVTFHTLRHTAATLLAELDVAESKRKAVMGHERLETTQRYTHMRPVHEVAPLEQLSEALPITDLVTQPWTRARREKPAQESVKETAETSGHDRRKRAISGNRPEPADGR